MAFLGLPSTYTGSGYPTGNFIPDDSCDNIYCVAVDFERYVLFVAFFLHKPQWTSPCSRFSLVRKYSLILASVNQRVQTLFSLLGYVRFSKISPKVN